MIQGLRVDVDGTITTVQVHDESSSARVTGIQGAIGCRYFDVVRLSGDIDVWVDDEGTYTSVPNPALTVMARLAGRPVSPLFGAGVFLAATSAGETVSLSEDQRAKITAWWADPRTQNAAILAVHGR